ncbi:FtsB family cell division protein [Subtercola sp. YIM 133946]|uniref:FtsB family cell division protein n=1 Tax=Subtercola sp. YIM 133946 TaxID=3118909 RepID=UPI002F92433E
MRPPATSSKRAASRPVSVKGGSARSRAPQGAGAGAAADGAGSTNWLRSIRFSGFTVLMLVVLVLFVVIVAPGARIFIEQRQQIADLQNDLQTAQAENSTLNAQVARWSDPAYIRAEARERLYFVMPGETSFLVLDDTGAGAAASTAPVSTGIQSTQSNWMAALFASGLTAGLSNQTADQLGDGGPAAATDPAATDPAATGPAATDAPTPTTTP